MLCTSAWRGVCGERIVRLGPRQSVSVHSLRSKYARRRNVRTVVDALSADENVPKKPLLLLLLDVDTCTVPSAHTQTRRDSECARTLSLVHERAALLECVSVCQTSENGPASRAWETVSSTLRGQIATAADGVNGCRSAASAIDAALARSASASASTRCSRDNMLAW